MSIKVVLFDLDGTLLPMDQDVFAKTYLGLLAKKVAVLGYEPEKLIAGIWAGTKDMVKNTGESTNEEVFWKTFCGIFGEDARKDEPYFDEYYRNEFQSVADVCGYNEKAKATVDGIKKMGYRVALATNPLFPRIATQSRIRWAGLEESDFEFYTTYENSSFCKPNLDYYRFVCESLDVLPEECLMVGNDVSEDMIAEKLNMKVFLLTDCLINKNNEDISKYPHGSFDELLNYIKAL